MREAHAHLFSLGRSLAMLRVGHCTSREQMLSILAERASQTPGNDWICAVQARIEGFAEDAAKGDTPRWPTRQELDAVTRGHPCIILSFDHHSAVANTAAFAAAGVSLTSPDPDGGVICREPVTGLANGLLLESAFHRVWDAAPQPAENLRAGIIRAAVDHLCSYGYVEVHDMLAQPWLGPLLARMHDRGELNIDVWLYAAPEHLPTQSKSGLPDYHRDRDGAGRGLVMLAGAKLFADGTLNSGTAWMLHSYVDGLPNHPSGTPLLNVREITNVLAMCQQRNIGLAVHAIGDGAVRAVLDARANIIQPSTLVIGDHRCPSLRIEHCELIDEADVPRFAAMETLASIQPCHLLSDIEVLQRKLPHRCDRVLPLADLIASGATPGELLWFGSDVPIVSADPADTYRAAVYRGRAEDNIRIAPKQGITVAECDRAFNVKKEPDTQ